MISNKENTFLLLKKISFRQIDKEWDEFFNANLVCPNEDWWKDRGWTREEFDVKWRRFNK